MATTTISTTPSPSPSPSPVLADISLLPLDVEKEIPVGSPLPLDRRYLNVVDKRPSLTGVIQTVANKTSSMAASATNAATSHLPGQSPAVPLPPPFPEKEIQQARQLFLDGSQNDEACLKMLNALEERFHWTTASATAGGPMHQPAVAATPVSPDRTRQEEALLAQAQCIQALLKNDSAHYDALITLCKQRLSAQPSKDNLVTFSRRSVAPWIEEVLYRACFFFLRSEYALAKPLDTFRVYLECMSYQELSFRPLKRISIVRTLLYFLITHFRQGNYQAPKPYSFDTESAFIPESLSEELSLLLSLYETLVLETVSYPHARAKNPIVDNLYNDITLIYGMMGHYEAPASLATSATSQYELLLESFFRAIGKTFRSRSIMRRFGWTATLAESMEEAMMGYKMYLEKDKKDKSGEWWRRKASPKEMDGESGDDVAGVLIAVTRLCLESLQTQSALVYAEKAVEVCKSGIVRADSVFLPLSLYYLGICFARLGVETLEHEHFHSLQEQSLVMLCEAEKLDLFHWRFHYTLALQYEEVGMIKEAIQHAKMSIRLNYTHIPSWHLLAILTASSGGSGDANWSEYEVALKAYKVCLTAGEAIVAGKRMSSRSEERWAQYVSSESHEEWLNLKMTETLLQEMILHNNLVHNKRTVATDPSQVAFAEVLEHLPSQIYDAYRNLFKTYAHVYYPLLTEDVKPAVETPTSAHPYKIDSMKATMKLGAILRDLTTETYPPLPSFFISTTPFSDPGSYNYTTPFSPVSQSSSHPLRRARFLRRRKQRYMEIWLQMAQMYRRLDRTHDAKMACLEAQRVERANADVEFEVSNLPAPIRQDLPFTVPNLAKKSAVDKRSTPFSEEPVSDSDDTETPTSLRNAAPDFIAAFSPHLSASGLAASSSTSPPKAHASSVSLDSPLVQAMQHFLAALIFDDEHLPARTWLGRCYWQQGRYELARVELERATKGGRVRGRKVWSSWHHLALAYESLGEMDRARECFSLAVEYESTAVPLTMLRGYEVLPRCV